MFKFLDAIADWLPGRKESYRNEIAKLERDIDEIMSRPMDGRNYIKLQSATERLRKLREKVANAV